MSEKQPSGVDWIASWIEQQRELLREQSAAAGSASPLQDLGRRWLDLGESYLSGLAQYSQSSAGPGSEGEAARQFKLGPEIVEAWRTAWAGLRQHHEGLGGFTDLLDRLPLLGLAREQAQAWRELAAAEAECRRLAQELSTVLSRVQADALSLLEQRTRERQQEQNPVTDFRALYDLWVECGEQVYAQVAHSDAYSKLQAELGNATIRLRSRQQTVIEHALKQFDLPTRSELNTVHRQLRELRLKLATMDRTGGAASPQPARRKSTRKSARRAKRTAAKSKSKRKTR